MTTLKISPDNILDMIRQLEQNRSLGLELDKKKHMVLGYKDGKIVIDLRLPLPFPHITQDEKLAHYLGKIAHPVEPFSIILIQAGNFALGYFENGEFLHHKALRTYVTRRKQGKSQLTYSQSGKKSGTAGSQLRYRNAISFFEKINETLNEWKTIDRSPRILYSCPVNLWNFLFNSKVKCPFDKNDPRLHKIPLDVRIPNYEEMLRINKLISFGYLTVHDPDLI